MTSERKWSAGPLPYPDRFYLEGAEGWLDLGNPEEADRELNGVAPERLTHPAVLALRWNITRKAGKLEDCLAIANFLTQCYPNDPCAWLALAQTLCSVGRISDAYGTGAAKAKEFPKFWPLLYDTACYACLLGQLRSAHWYLHLAMAAGDAKTIKLRALEDPDLKALWQKV